MLQVKEVDLDNTLEIANSYLQTEGTPPEEAFNPTVKRSGWQAPADSGLWKIADSVEQSVSFCTSKQGL